VDTNDRNGEILECFLEDFTDDRTGVVDGAFGDIFNGDDAVLAVEKDNLKNFFLQIPHAGH
jgi:hypothetical protein